MKLILVQSVFFVHTFSQKCYHLPIIYFSQYLEQSVLFFPRITHPAISLRLIKTYQLKYTRMIEGIGNTAKYL